MLLRTGGIAGLLLVTLGAGPDPESLVSRLGSNKYAEREAASSALEKLGQAAFPALKSARNDRDPEVKSRAEQLLDTIERSMLTRPTMIPLEPRAYSLVEIADRLGKSQGMTLPLGEMGNRDTRTRRFLRSETVTSVGFWPALDRVGLIPEWEADQNDFGRPMMRRTISVRLVPKDGRPSGPSVDQGPFRLVAQRPRFEAEPTPMPNRFGPGPGFGQRQFIIPPPEPARERDLVVPIDIMAEPRLTLRTISGVRILEAVDDGGSSLTPAARPAFDPTPMFGNFDRFVPPLTLQVALRRPEVPIKAIAKLRGVAMVEIEARKFEPTAIPLAPQTSSERRPVDCGGMSVMILGLTAQNPDSRMGPVLDLVIRPDGWITPMPFRRGGRGRPWMGQMPDLDLDQILQNIEVVDARGIQVRGILPRNDGPDADGIRVRLYLPARDGTESPPAELRCYGTIRAAVEIPFEFRNLKVAGVE